MEQYASSSITMMQQALAGLRSSGCTAAAAARPAISALTLAEEALIPSLEQSSMTLGTSTSATSSTPGAAGLWPAAYRKALIGTPGGLPGRSGGCRDTPAVNSIGGCHSVLLGPLQAPRYLSAQAQHTAQQPAEPLGSVASAATPPGAAAARAAQSDVRQQQHQPQQQDYRGLRQEDSGGSRGGWEDEAEPAPIPLDPNVKPPGFLFVTTGAALSALLAVGVATLGIVGTFYAGYAISQVAKELRSFATTTGAGATDDARSTTAGSTTKDSGGASGSSSSNGRNGAQGRSAAPEVLAAAVAARKDGSPGVGAGAVGGSVEAGGRSAATQPAARGAGTAAAPPPLTQSPQGQAGTEAVGEGRRPGSRSGRSWLAWVFGFGRWRKPQQGEHRQEQVPEPAGSG